eukprot:s1305_g27.t1
MACELWVAHKNPRIQVWSYVDNIETLTANAEDACASKELLTEFCQLLDLEVDQSKSYCWSTTARGRKKIREANCESKLFARDLGGHMSYGRLKTNMTITQKIELLQPFWHRTARSCAPNSQKQRAILTAAWPNLFYGISTVTIGSCHYDKLRTLANKAIGCTQAGVAPSLQLSCLCATKMDPEFYCLVHTVKSYRDCHSADLSMLTMSATVEGSLTSQGPCASLLHCLHKIAWSWDSRNFCVDHNNDPVDILSIPMPLLEERLQEAWHMRTFSTLETMRNTMQGLPRVDACLTRECLLSLPNDHQGLMRHVAVCLSSNDLLDIDTFLQKHLDRLPARQIRRDMANAPKRFSPGVAGMSAALRRSSFLFVSGSTVNHESIKYHAERVFARPKRARLLLCLRQLRRSDFGMLLAPERCSDAAFFWATKGSSGFALATSLVDSGFDRSTPVLPAAEVPGQTERPCQLHEG